MTRGQGAILARETLGPGKWESCHMLIPVARKRTCKFNWGRPEEVDVFGQGQPSRMEAKDHQARNVTATLRVKRHF